MIAFSTNHLERFKLKGAQNPMNWSELTWGYPHTATILALPLAGILGYPKRQLELMGQYLPGEEHMIANVLRAIDYQELENQ